MDIELRLLRSFVALHEVGSVSRAAERMACTQAAMSMRLKQVEAEIGAPLFLRHPGGLVPTPRGTTLYSHAVSVLAAYDEMLAQVRTRPQRDRLRLGMPDDYALGWLPGLIADLGPAFERLEIELVCDLSANLVAAIDRRDIDLALVTTATPPPRTRTSVELPLVWLTGAPSTDGQVTLAAYPAACVFRSAMTRTLDAAGLPWRIGVQSRGQAGIFAAVRSGRVVSAVVAGTGPGDLVETTSAPGLPAQPPVPQHRHLAQRPTSPTQRAPPALAHRQLSRTRP
ncbi:LysR family transcriptional regulator [Tabrizicola sp.]|uniref:LysR family transcriptional regulator n=1 Tax=Tabrizicola sp. TaxID=2005166 RepID=UPI0035B0F89D